MQRCPWSRCAALFVTPAHLEDHLENVHGSVLGPSNIVGLSTSDGPQDSPQNYNSEAWTAAEGIDSTGDNQDENVEHEVDENHQASS